MTWRRNINGQWRIIPKQPTDINIMLITPAKRRAIEEIHRLIPRIEEQIIRGEHHLFTDRKTRYHEANDWIKTTARIYQEENNNGTNEIWASDASATPADAKWHEPRSITTAVVGPKKMLFKQTDMTTGVLHGEIAGIIGQTILSKKTVEISQTEQEELIGYTDHLSSQRLTEDIRTMPNPEEKLRDLNGRSLYRWLTMCLSENPIVFKHVKSHTGINDPKSLANEKADALAKDGHSRAFLPVLPDPTFARDEYAIRKKNLGWIESNIKALTENIMIKQTWIDLREKSERYANDLYDLSAHPTWMYTHTTSAFSAVTQWYARSGQIPTRATLQRRGIDTKDYCRFGCPQSEDTHHLFVECAHFDEIRNESKTKLIEALEKILSHGDERADESDANNRIRQIGATLYEDEAKTWPIGASRYYLGHVPKLDTNNNGTRIIPEMPIKRRRIVHNEMHVTSIRLAGRIFGIYMREAAKQDGIYAKKKPY
jgi:hypothetical protein